MSELDSLETLLEDQLRDIYSAEKQLLKALPMMAKAAESETLREAFETHIQETEEQVERLEQIAKTIDITLTGKKCKAMEGLIEGGTEAIEAQGNHSLIDAALIFAAQRVEHHEISAYGSARAVAERLNLAEVVDLLQTSLDEESATDEKLTEICESEMLSNVEASDSDEEEGEELDAVEDWDEEEEAGPSNGSGGGKKSGKRSGGERRT